MGTSESDSEQREDEALRTLIEQQNWLSKLAEKLVQDHSAAMDLVQETFLAALRNPPLDATRPRAWLSAVARRIWHKQQPGFGPQDVESIADFEYSSSPLPEDGEKAAMRWEAFNTLNEAVNTLKPRNRETVLLTYQDELGQAEVARRMESTSRAVRYRLKQSHEEIRRMLRDKGLLRVGDPDAEWKHKEAKAAGETNLRMRVVIDPGSAPPEEIGELLGLYSTLYRGLGGSGIDFRLKGVLLMDAVGDSA